MTDDHSAGPVPAVAIIVLNWNGIRDTSACLDSLKEITYANASIIVVDNGSVDESVKVLREHEGIELIENASNLGYALGNNAGIQAALLTHAEYFLLLNNDTETAPDFLFHLVKTIREDPRIAAVGPKLKYFDEPDRIWAAGGRITYRETVTGHRGYRARDDGAFDLQTDVDYLPGTALLVSRTALEAVGLLDPVFSPAYFEDADWCVRARRAGFRVVYEPRAVVYHKVSASTGGAYNAFERYHLGYNSTIFMRRYANWQQWCSYLLFAVLSLPIVFVVRAFRGAGRAVIFKGLGIADGLSGRPRREVKVR